MAVKSNFQQVLLKTLIPTMNTLKDMVIGILGINRKIYSSIGGPVLLLPNQFTQCLRQKQIQDLYILRVCIFLYLQIDRYVHLYYSTMLHLHICTFVLHTFVQVQLCNFVQLYICTILHLNNCTVEQLYICTIVHINFFNI